MNTVITRSTDADAGVGLSGLRLIADNYDAFAARLLAARSAQHSLDLMYYLWHDDQSGRLLAEEVVKAAERGVRVRMLIDDINSRSSDAGYLELDSHPNIELRLFNPTAARNGSFIRKLELAVQLVTMTRRMHTKAWIVDGHIALVGGRNIGDAYFDAAETNFRDLDILLVGAAVAQTADIFQAFWDSELAAPVRELHSKPGPQTPVSSSRVDSEVNRRLLVKLGNGSPFPISWRPMNSIGSKMYA